MSKPADFLDLRRYAEQRQAALSDLIAALDRLEAMGMICTTPRPWVETNEAPPASPPAPMRNSARAIQREKFAPGPTWTTAEIEKAIDMAARGYTIAEVARELGRPEHGTRKKLGQHSAEVKARAAVELSKRSKAPAKPEPVQQEQPPSDWTADQDAALRRYMRNDMGIGSAAAMLKRPRDEVAARWEQIGQEAAE